MYNLSNRLSPLHKYLFGSLLLLVVSFTCLAFSLSDSGGLDTSRREVLLRKIGHEILLQVGDSTSRVLPIQKTAENEYRINFENAFSFKTDSLVSTIRGLLADDPLTTDYVVNVMDKDNGNVTYGFAVSAGKEGDIVSCNGRKQPAANYTIVIKYKPAFNSMLTNRYLLSSLPFLAFIGFIIYKPAKARQPSQANQPEHLFLLNETTFDAQNRTLCLDDTITTLTGTESRVLRILASSPNETIQRSRLQKELWEDEGVIVGRSLDMFISKLRKKLEPDTNINIVVVRGKGYQLKTRS